MLDVVFPVQARDVRIAPEALELLERRTDVPVRVIVVVDGGTRSDMAPIESFLKGSSMQWVLLHEEKPVGLNRCIAAALPQVKNPCVAFMQPHVRLADDRWFGKMQQVLMKDQLTGIIDTIPNTGSSAIYPVKRSTHRLPEPGCPLALLSGRFLTGRGAPSGAVDPVHWWAQQSLACGGTVWHAGGVAYSTVEHKEHPLWREPSEGRARAGSSSRTTPGSSTRTITDTDGPQGFAL